MPAPGSSNHPLLVMPIFCFLLAGEKLSVMVPSPQELLREICQAYGFWTIPAHIVELIGSFKCVIGNDNHVVRLPRLSELLKSPCRSEVVRLHWLWQSPSRPQLQTYGASIHTFGSTARCVIFYLNPTLTQKSWGISRISLQLFKSKLVMPIHQ